MSENQKENDSAAVRKDEGFQKLGIPFFLRGPQNPGYSI